MMACICLIYMHLLCSKNRAFINHTTSEKPHTTRGQEPCTFLLKRKNHPFLFIFFSEYNSDVDTCGGLILPRLSKPETYYTHGRKHGERAQFGRRPAPLLRLAALLLGAGLEVEHAVLAVPGRAPADAAVQLLPWVVVAHDVPALDAPDQTNKQSTLLGVLAAAPPTSPNTTSPGRNTSRFEDEKIHTSQNSDTTWLWITQD